MPMFHLRGLGHRRALRNGFRSDVLLHFRDHGELGLRDTFRVAFVEARNLLRVYAYRELARHEHAARHRFPGKVCAGRQTSRKTVLAGR
jgi:hypothetical protein